MTDGKAEFFEARGIVKFYGRYRALHDVSVCVQAGQKVGLIGANGAGKTTCFSILAGLLAAERGTIVLNGRDITAVGCEGRCGLRIGYVPQEPSVFQGLSLENNLRMVLELHERCARTRAQRLEQLLSEFSLLARRSVDASLLSGGERRRLEIARALCCSPRFLLLDEPLSGLDPLAVAKIEAILTDLAQSGIGFLITDHNVYELLHFVDRAYVLHEGEVIASGSARSIARDARVQHLYLGKRFAAGYEAAKGK